MSMHGEGVAAPERVVRVPTRDPQLDLLRGIAVAGMFFFSFVLTLSDSLPMILAHNIPGKLLPGDFVLSLFLFCSGISLAMIRSRYPRLSDLALWRRLGTRIAQMVLVSLFVTPFSVGRVLGMDEMMLNVVLTIPSLIIIGLGPRVIWVATVVVWCAYLVLARLALVPETPSQYLGGYQMAIFWLPMLLGGALVYSLAHCHMQRARCEGHMERCEWEMARQLGVWLALSLGAILVSGWPDKMRVNPAFGCLSVALCIVVLGGLRQFSLRCRWLEYFGSKPLRMWGLMFCLLGPVRLYGEMELQRSVLNLSPTSAVLISISWMGCCYFISRGYDRVALAFTQKRPSRGHHA